MLSSNLLHFALRTNSSCGTCIERSTVDVFFYVQVSFDLRFLVGFPSRQQVFAQLIKKYAFDSYFDNLQ